MGASFWLCTLRRLLVLLADGEFPPRIGDRNAAKLIRQVVEAVKYLHENNILYKDINKRLYIFDKTRNSTPKDSRMIFGVEFIGWKEKENTRLIKAMNILFRDPLEDSGSLTGKEVLKLVDFGLAAKFPSFDPNTGRQRYTYKEFSYQYNRCRYKHTVTRGSSWWRGRTRCDCIGLNCIDLNEFLRIRSKNCYFYTQSIQGKHEDLLFDGAY